MRRGRVEYPGAMYHVIHRGNNRENVFERSEDKNYLIEQLRNSVAVDGIELFAYVVMGNHYHLALRTCVEPLSKVMHRINTRYGLYYNRAMERTGHVFEGRYKAIPVNNERYLIALVKYIHRNPVRAGICNSVGDYPWSSDHFYRKLEAGFVENSLLLNILSGDRKKSVQEYSLLMDQDEKYVPEEQIITTSDIQEGRKDKKTNRKLLDEILIETGVNNDELELIKRGSRMRRLSVAKEIYSKNAMKEGYSMEEIAQHINISAVAVFKYINKQEGDKLKS